MFWSLVITKSSGKHFFARCQAASLKLLKYQTKLLIRVYRIASHLKTLMLSCLICLDPLAPLIHPCHILVGKCWCTTAQRSLLHSQGTVHYNNNIQWFDPLPWEARRCPALCLYPFQATPLKIWGILTFLELFPTCAAQCSSAATLELSPGWAGAECQPVRWKWFPIILQRVFPGSRQWWCTHFSLYLVHYNPKSYYWLLCTGKNCLFSILEYT